MNYKELISSGRSVRSFEEDAIGVNKLEAIRAYIRANKRLVTNIDVEARFFEGEDPYKRLYGVAGYEGIMIKAPDYLIILSEKKPQYIENAGYIGERSILKARDLGIDSCWVTFKDSDAVKEALSIESEKEVVAIIALGFATDESKSLILNAAKTGDNYSKTNLDIVDKASFRKGIEEIVFMDKWGNAADAETLETRALLEAFSYARMAPSSLNKQPWRFIVDGGKVVLAIKNKNYKDSYENKIDAGIVMLYFGLILDITMFDSKWGFEDLNKEYGVPEDFVVVGYCNI